MDIDPLGSLQAFNSAFTASQNLKIIFDRAKETIATLQSSKGFTQLARDLDTRDAISVLRGQILDAQELNFALREEIAKMREEYIELKKQKEEFDRYELHQTPQEATVLKLKSECANGEPMHYLCPDCKETGRKAILQGAYTKSCHVCNRQFHFETAPGRDVWAYDAFD